MTNTRVYYFDNMKTMLTIHVIIFHVVIVFGGAGAFIISSPTSASPILGVIMTGFLAFSQSYFMGIFFTISAVFSYKSLSKKGKRSFIKNKFRRLFIPALIYYLFLSPFMLAIKDVFYKGIMIDDLIPKYNIGAIWFILMLFIFDLSFALLFYRKDTTNSKTEKVERRYSLGSIIGIVLFVSIITYIVRIIFPVGYFLPIVGFQLAHLPQYILAYIIGVKISRHDMMDNCKRKHQYLLFLLIPLLIAMSYVIRLMFIEFNDITYAFGGANIYSLLYSFFDQAMYMIMLFGLFSFFKFHFNYSNKLLAYLSSQAFAAYIAHSFVIVVLVIIINNLTVPHLMNFFITSILACMVSFTLAKYIKV